MDDFSINALIVFFFLNQESALALGSSLYEAWVGLVSAARRASEHARAKGIPSFGWFGAYRV